MPEYEQKEKCRQARHRQCKGPASGQAWGCEEQQGMTCGGRRAGQGGSGLEHAGPQNELGSRGEA